MPANLFRGDYEDLAKVAQKFGREHDNVQRSIDQLQQQVSVLQGGDWVGAGAQAFYAEMNGDVLPSLRRLVQALQSAQQTATKIGREIKRAEDEAAAIFKDRGIGYEAAAAKVGDQPNNLSSQPSQVNAEKGEMPKERISSSDMPKAPAIHNDEGAGVFASRRWDLQDFAVETLFLGGAQYFDVKGNNHAADHMRHYLGATGTPLTVQPEEIAKAIPLFQAEINSSFRHMQQIVVDKLKQEYHGQTMQFEVQTPWTKFYAMPGLSQDWYYAMGGFSFMQAGVVTVTPPADPSGKPIIKIDYVTRVYDYYNWDNGKSVTIQNPTNLFPTIPERYQAWIRQQGDHILVQDHALAELHRAGIAREFEITGETSIDTKSYKYDDSDVSTSSGSPLIPIPEERF